MGLNNQPIHTCEDSFHLGNLHFSFIIVQSQGKLSSLETTQPELSINYSSDVKGVQVNIWLMFILLTLPND